MQRSVDLGCCLGHKPHKPFAFRCLIKIPNSVIPSSPSSMHQWYHNFFICSLLPLVHLFICSFVHLFTSSLVHFFHLFTCSLLHLFTCSLVHLFTCSLLHLFTCSLLHLFTSSFVHFFICSFVHFQRVSTPFLPAETQLKHTKKSLTKSLTLRNTDILGPKKEVKKNNFE